jgi:hypothetical protein
MLWHSLTGPLLTTGISEYRLLEVTNMQMDEDLFSMSLSPRLEFNHQNERYPSSAGFEALPICIGCAENEEELFKVSIELIQNKE